MYEGLASSVKLKYIDETADYDSSQILNSSEMDNGLNAETCTPQLRMCASPKQVENARTTHTGFST